MDYLTQAVSIYGALIVTFLLIGSSIISLTAGPMVYGLLFFVGILTIFVAELAEPLVTRNTEISSFFIFFVVLLAWNSFSASPLAMTSGFATALVWAATVAFFAGVIKEALRFFMK